MTLVSIVNSSYHNLKIEWICDIGVSQHMDGNIDLFYDLHYVDPNSFVIIPNGSVCHVNKIGNIKLTNNII